MPDTRRVFVSLGGEKPADVNVSYIVKPLPHPLHIISLGIQSWSGGWVGEVAGSRAKESTIALSFKIVSICLIFVPCIG